MHRLRCLVQRLRSGLSSGWGILGRFGWVEGSEGAPAGLGWCKNPATRSSYYKAEGRTGQEAKGLNGGGEIQVRCQETCLKTAKRWNRLPGRAEMLWLRQHVIESRNHRVPFTCMACSLHHSWNQQPHKLHGDGEKYEEN